MKIAHLTDLHYSRKNKDAALASLETFRQTCADEDVDVIVSSGDLFDAGIQNSDKDGFPELLDAIGDLLEAAPIYAVYGTPTHDIMGCYQALERLNAPNQFTILERGEYTTCAGLLIIGMGEPSKAWLLAGKTGIGKDEAKEAIESGMRKSLLGAGATRKKYRDYPCVFIYHGSVRGASMCNGQTVPQGEIAIGRDDLALVGADYYALGHIHLAQQIEGIPAYYGGSAFPNNWGETDKKTFPIMVFEEGKLSDGGFFPYPHPPRKKLDIDVVARNSYGETTLSFDFDPWFDVIDDGFELWLNIHASKELAALIESDSVLSAIRDYGALEGSRVTVEIIPTETVRAAEIRETKRLRDKVKVWADASDETCAESIYDKADTIEETARETGGAPVAHRWRIDRLILRGATGIWKNSGRDEIDIDLLTYDPGLIALVGENGSGKSTLIENMHPFPQMLTRPGKLQDHFRLRESYRDLYFTDEITGDEYNAKLLIDGQNKSGSVEHWLYCNGRPIVNGRKADYEEAIAGLYGSLSLYLRSAFSAQKPTKNNPDISDATQGEKKSLFLDLSGIGYLQTYCEDARGRAKVCEDEAALLSAKLEALPGLETELFDNDARIDNIKKTQADADALAGCELFKADGIKKQVDALAPIVEQHEADKAESMTIEARLDQQQCVIENTSRTIDIAQKSIEGKTDAEHDVEQYEEHCAGLAEQEAKRKAALEADNTALTEYNNLAAAYNNARGAYDQERNAIETEIRDREKDKSNALDRVDDLTARLAEKIVCPNCSHEFAHDEERLSVDLVRWQQDMLDTDVYLNTAKQSLEAMSFTETEPERPEPTPEAMTEVLGIPVASITRIKSLIADINIYAARATIEDAREAETQIAVATAQRDEAKNQRAEAADRRLELGARMAAMKAQVEKHATLTTDYDGCREHYDEIMREISQYKAQITEAQRAVDSLKEKRDALTLTKGTRDAGIIQATEWRILERACSRDGIQALELDALAPAITDVVNRLLSAAYGGRFAVEIQTTRIAGSGARAKQVEDFEIVIYDAERETSQALDTLSGGEAVRIRKALYDAFGLLRAQNTGLQFQTVMLDEADGALDTDARAHYFDMIESAHIEAGRAHTIVISHAAEVQDMIGQKIDMGEM